MSRPAETTTGEAVASAPGEGAMPTTGEVAALVVATLIDRGETVATGESLTGGLVVARLVDIPGASAAVRGGVVAYHSDLKASLLGVDPEVLSSRGAVDADVAGALARGAARRLGADWGVGTTGVAGPDPADGARVGTVFVAVSGAGGVTVARLSLTGDRARIREDAVRGALELLLAQLAPDMRTTRPAGSR